MTVSEVIARIVARGFTVTSAQTDNLVTLTVKNAAGNVIPWVAFTVSTRNAVADVPCLGSFHGGKVTGLGDYPTAVIYGDVYLAHPRQPAQAEKAIAAMLARPALEPVEGFTRTIAA